MRLFAPHLVGDAWSRLGGRIRGGLGSVRKQITKRTKGRRTGIEGEGQGGKKGHEGVRKELQRGSRKALQVSANGKREEPRRPRRSRQEHDPKAQKSREGQRQKADAKRATESAASSRRKDRFVVAPALGEAFLEKTLNSRDVVEVGGGGNRSFPWFATYLHILAF